MDRSMDEVRLSNRSHFVLTSKQLVAILSKNSLGLVAKIDSQHEAGASEIMAMLTSGQLQFSFTGLVQVLTRIKSTEIKRLLRRTKGLQSLGKSWLCVPVETHGVCGS